MIKRLRRKFILITMFSLFVVMLTLIAAINAVNIYRSSQKITAVMELLSDNGGTFPKNPFPHGSDRREPARMGDPELPFTTRFCTVQLDGDKNILSISTDNIAALTEEDVASYTAQVLQKNNTKGWIGNYKYQLTEKENGYLLLFFDASAEKESMMAVLLISLTVGLGAYLLVFLLVALISGRAIKPIAESYEKQKQFITDAGHELKTPLTVISANSEILAMNFGENEWCDSIDRQTEKMRNLVGQMVLLSRMDEETPRVRPEKFNLSDAVFDTAMAFENVAGRKGKSFSAAISPDLFYTGDEAEIRQLVSILMDNAVKYCDDGGKIFVELKKEKKIVLSVRNTYQKAAELEYGRLFDRFYRADKARQANGSYGLGLSIAKSIAERQKASIKARPVKDGEILFTVIL